MLYISGICLLLRITPGVKGLRNGRDEAGREFCSFSWMAADRGGEKRIWNKVDSVHLGQWVSHIIDFESQDFTIFVCISFYFLKVVFNKISYRTPSDSHYPWIENVEQQKSRVTWKHNKMRICGLFDDLLLKRRYQKEFYLSNSIENHLMLCCFFFFNYFSLNLL